MIGVSPGFYISAYGPGFRIDDVLTSVARVARIGFGAMQLEIYRPEAVEEWTPANRAAIRTRMADLGIVPSQFVVHFAMEDFRNAAGLRDPAFSGGFARAVDLAAGFPDCPVVTLPLPPYRAASGETFAELVEARARMSELLGMYGRSAADAGKVFAVEITPGSLLGGLSGLRLLRETGERPDIRCNLDTGHAMACKEHLPSAAAALGGAIAGTHLCDNYGYENLKLVPGDGAIDFPCLLRVLLQSGYAGSFDVELACAPGYVEEEYARARLRIAGMLDAAAGRRDPPMQERKAG